MTIYIKNTTPISADEMKDLTWVDIKIEPLQPMMMTNGVDTWECTDEYDDIEVCSCCGQPT